MKFMNAFGKLPKTPIDPTWITEGTPETWSKIASRCTNGCTLRVWECTTGKFALRYSEDETIFVLIGEAKLKEPDEVLWWHCNPGTTAFIKRGSIVEWDVAKYVLILRFEAPRATVAMLLRPLRYQWYEFLQQCKWRLMRVWRMLT